MKRHGILNSNISRVLSSMGHTDRIAIADCGLPVPEGTERIDLAVTFGNPRFMDVLKAVSSDMKIEAGPLSGQERQRPMPTSSCSPAVSFKAEFIWRETT